MDNPLVQADPGLYIWTILTFLGLLFLLRLLAWKPLLAMLKERQDTIAKSLDDAKQARQELERLHARVGAHSRRGAQRRPSRSSRARATMRTGSARS